VIVVRYQLQDGFSDDVIGVLAKLKCFPAPKVIVLLSAGSPSAVESRQLMLGADCVQRDPVRSDVLMAYLEKYLHSVQSTPPSHSTRLLRFSAATLHPLTRTLQHRDRSVILTPRESMLLELLIAAEPDVVSYETLYNEILERRFRGDTSNMRVLLGKLNISARKVGVALRSSVDVIPKTGYRYRGPDHVLI
jgi:DNA-binding response OmpR family regulator